MSNISKLLIASAISGFVAQAAVADTLLNDGDAADEFGTLSDKIADEAESNEFTFGNEGREVGTYGSVALRASITDTTSRTTDLSIGAQYGIYNGVYGSEFNLVYAYSATDNVVGTDTLNAGYDLTRDFNPAFFGYANLNIKWDNMATLATENARDAFAGFGVGYRVLNSDATKLSVKAGPGYRFIENGIGDTVNEAAYSVEANFFQRFNDTVYLSNDLQIIGSASDISATNELALNVAMSNALSLRTSYLVEFSGPDYSSLDSTKDVFGVSLVYSFN